MLDDPKLIAAIVLLVTNIAALVKVFADVLKIKADRAEVKSVRDADSQSLHDTVLKQGFMIQQCRDSLSLYQTVQEDLKTELNILNTNVAKLTVVVETLSETVKEIKNAKT